jgi:hypothetical protein
MGQDFANIPRFAILAVAFCLAALAALRGADIRSDFGPVVPIGPA